MELPFEALGNAIHRGTIIHSNNFKAIGHGKFFVVMGVDEHSIVGFFFINSNIHPAIFKRQALLDMQYPMKKSDYQFLRYDSFLCASNLMTIERQSLVSDISSGTARIIGEMRQEHLADILAAARNSILFTDYQKQSFFSE